MKKARTNQEKQVFWAVITICIVAAAVPITIIIARQSSLKNVDSFDTCKTAGGTVMESYPERCRINKKTFVNEAQKPEGAYIGLSEAKALDKAKQEGIAARVVERDGEALMVTMDLAEGRHNFYVKDGKVYRVEVEHLR